MPETPPGRVVSRTRAAARVALSAVAQALSDYALTVVPTTADRHATPDEWATIARRIKLGAQEFQFRAVALMREEGATWGQVATAFGYRDRPDASAATVVRDIYEGPYLDWRDGGRNGFHPAWMATSRTDADDDPAQVAASLDRWYVERAGAGAGHLIGVARPVTDGLYG